MKRARWLFLSVALLVTGCTGARATLDFSASKYPISLSDMLLDEDGRVVGGAQLEKVGRLQIYERFWGTGYSAIPLNTGEVAEELNRQVRRAGGEGVRNLTVQQHMGCLAFNAFTIGYNLLPVSLGCVSVTLVGDIVRRRIRPATAKRRAISTR